MSILDLQGLDLPRGHKGGKHSDNHKSSKKRNKSCWSNCHCKDD